MSPKVEFSFFKKGLIKPFLFILAGVIAAGLIIWFGTSKRTQTSLVPTEIASSRVDKKFNVNAIRISDKKPSKVEINLTEAELKTQIKYKDKPLSVASDKAFLLFRIEIKNDTPEKVLIPTADFIRLKFEDKLFAPDYHNGNVIIEPISTRADQVVFVVKRDMKEFVFLLGEPSGEKEEISVKF